MDVSGKSVLIIGGGVAGIASALPLADAGFRVQILEKRPLLGGRASSFIDHKTGERIDEGQHGTMRCCTNLAALYERLGVHDQIRYFDTIPFLDGEGKRSVIQGCGLPAPLHTALSFLRFRSLNLADKLAVARGMLAMLMAKPDPGNEALDIGTWFQRKRQTERAIRRFWEPILVSVCNEDLSRISCTHAFQIFRAGFLLNAQAFHFGVPRVPLGTLYTEPTLAYLQRRGGCVRLRTTVAAIHLEGGAHGQITGVSLMDGERLEADYYVSALQCDLLLKLLPSDVTRGVPYWENLKQIELSPIIGVHLWFDRPLDCPHALALLDRETDWIFNKTRNFDRSEQEGAYLSMVISASAKFTAMSKEGILALVLADVRACLPAARQANVVRSYVVKWPKATLAPRPGVEALRPDQRSPLSNLYVAGEWTQTGWPSTMEGAARSGYRAAEYLLEREGRPQRLLVPDLPPSGLARLLDGHRRVR
jgi:squalene-associated FAD-dependent desaturase